MIVKTKIDFILNSWEPLRLIKKEKEKEYISGGAMQDRYE